MQVMIRMDVDVPTNSLIKNKIKIWSGPKCQHLLAVLKLCSDYDIKLLIALRPNVLPDPLILESILVRNEHEICLHANGVTVKELLKEKKKLEEYLKMPINGLAYHGNDLTDGIVHLVLRKDKYASNPGTPFTAMLAGFEYDCTGYPDSTIDVPTKLIFGEQSICVFPQHKAVDIGDRVESNKVTELFEKELSMICFHSNYLFGYGFRSKTHCLILKIFKTIKKNNIQLITPRDWLGKV